MRTKPIFLHLIFLSMAVLLVLGISFYQVVVNQSHGRIPLRHFLQPQTFLQAAQAVFYHSAKVDQSELYFQSGESILSVTDPTVRIPIAGGMQKVFILPTQKYLTSIDGTTLSITNLNSGETISMELPKGFEYQAQTWSNDQTVILSARDQENSWKIISVDLQKKVVTPIIPSFFYSGETLSISSEALTTLIAYPDCQPLCELVIFDLSTHQEVQRLPAFTSADKMPSISDMVFDFFDPQEGLVAYHSPSQEQLYVINRKLELLQQVRMENERDSVLFLGYIPTTKQLAFTLIQKNSSEQFIVLYAADRPSLHIVKKVPKTDSVLLLAKAQAFAINQDIYSLDGELQKILTSKENNFIPVY